MKDWIMVNGRKLLWESFIRSLDYYRGDSVIWKRGDVVRSQYCRMICPLQELIAHYHKGKDSIDDWLEKYMVDDGVTVPEEKKLPEAIEIVFNQIQECIQVDLSKLLDECVVDSVRTYERIQEEIRKENERIETIRLLPVSHESFKEKDVIKKVSYLVDLHRHKIDCPDYSVEKEETLATNMWCELLISGCFSDKITYGMMTRAVENGFLAESAISNLLSDKYNIDKDYEWYSEDFLGCGLDLKTDIKITDFLELCEGEFRRILGINWD